jgi:mannose-6-phosphate isomerase-like protein (cupin superfamily)
MSGERRELPMRYVTWAIAAMAFMCQRAAAGPPQPAGPGLWTKARIQSLSRTLEASGAPYTQIVKGDTYGVLLLRRTVSGTPELHVKLNDFFVVLSGAAEVRVGGRVTGAKTVAPDEERGQKLIGGTRYPVRQGDVLFVPANHWLQVLVAKGDVVRALIIKTR